jgi:hypothetical protein
MYFLATATMVAGNCLNITLHTHCLYIVVVIVVVVVVAAAAVVVVIVVAACKELPNTAIAYLW